MPPLPVIKQLDVLRDLAPSLLPDVGASPTPPLPGSAKYYIHNWNARLRDAVTRLEAFTKAVLNGENDIQVPVTATWVPVVQNVNPLTMRNVVPRDRIELSTPAFSGLCSAN